MNNVINPNELQNDIQTTIQSFPESVMDIYTSSGQDSSNFDERSNFDVDHNLQLSSESMIHILLATCDANL
jgi:hypothetical protein